MTIYPSGNVKASLKAKNITLLGGVAYLPIKAPTQILGRHSCGKYIPK